jgi:hypothetical protein
MRARRTFVAITAALAGCGGASLQGETGLPALGAADAHYELFQVTQSGFTIPWAVSPRGDIAGTAGTAGGWGFVRDSAGTVTTLRAPGGLCTSARGISPSGEVVGFYQTISCGGPGGEARPGARGFQRHKDGSFELVDADLPGARATIALGINPQGDVVGAYLDTANKTHGFLRHHGQFVTIDVPRATLTTCRGINAAGDITGRYDDAHGTHGFLRRPNGEIETVDYPGATSTIAGALNPEGDIVGRYFIGSVMHSFLRTAGGEWLNIDVPGGTNTDATGISPSGEIVGRVNVVVNGSSQTLGFIRTR